MAMLWPLKRSAPVTTLLALGWLVCVYMWPFNLRLYATICTTMICTEIESLLLKIM
jgi:hypothetical protein